LARAHNLTVVAQLRPVTCGPLTRDRKNPSNIQVNDVLGNYSLTLIDSLSTLAILASAPPDERNTGPEALQDFQDGVAALVEQYGDGRPGPSGQGLRARGFDLDSKVQVFETVIRGLGGLLSAHLFAVGELPITGYNISNFSDGQAEDRQIRWPNNFVYDGQLLRLALDLAQRLLPAFYSSTGLPYPRVNLRHGIPFYQSSPLHGGPPLMNEDEGPMEITETCSAGAGSLVLEFTVLSRLTGDSRFEQLAKRAFWAVWYRKSSIGLIGAGMDPENGHWIGAYSVIGAGADSFFEYALKSHILLSGHELPNRTAVQKPLSDDWLDPNTLYAPLTEEENAPESFLQAWHHAHAAIKRHLYTDRDHPHYVNVNLWTGSLMTHWVDSLGAYYSGLLTLAGEVDEAVETNLLYTAMWTRYSALPERWSYIEKTVEGGLGWWPLRPELIESTYHLYRATKDPYYLYVGEMILRDITRRCWTPCGWAGLQNVLNGEQSDRMESFFLGETTKYMYLLYDDDHPLNSLDAAYVFTTEGHPLIIPRKPHEKKRRVVKPATSRQVAVYDYDGFTTSCPVPPRVSPLTGSLTAARPDIFNAAKMIDLHLTPSNFSVSFQSETRRAIPSTNHSVYPWTLPVEMLPENGTCAQPNEPLEVSLEFATNAQQVVGGPPFNFLLGSQYMERLTNDKVRVSSLSGLKLSMRQEEDLFQAPYWRITRVNGVLLGRDESIVLDRSILGEVSDPRFNLVRDAVVVRLHQLHEVDLSATERLTPSADEVDAETSPEADVEDFLVFDGEQELSFENFANDSEPLASLASRVKMLLQRMTSIGEPSAQTRTPSPPPGTQYPFNLVINQTGLTPTGVGAAPLPAADVPPGIHFAQHGPISLGHLPWTTVFGAGEACTGPLPDVSSREHQVIVIRRGGCSFSEKLANIPSFTPSPTALQLVVIVSDDNEQVGHTFEHGYGFNYEHGAIRPMLERPQLTPAGLERRNPVAMILVGGGDVGYHQLAMAKQVGITRRYHIESQGMRIRNLIVDDGDAGMRV
jgi:hypothetical protein